jgi:phosphatidylethanolamine/phosphatidyl-N-methylethanolamine N-methyltransferase
MVTAQTFVAHVYDKVASVYDWAYGPLLQPGRRRAVARMGLRAGMRVLEVGIGTGLTLGLYPDEVDVTGVDCSSGMLDLARERCGRLGRPANLIQMDASRLQFPDGSFDVVFAPYVISVVPEPVTVLREMARVCRPGGSVIVLNHFRSRRAWLARVERWLSPHTIRLGFRTDLDRDAVFAQAGLPPPTVELVNRPRIWSLVTFVTPGESPSGPPG